MVSARKKSQPRHTTWNVTNWARRTRPRPTGLEGKAAVGPAPPAPTADELTDAVVEAPDHEGPGRPVPQAAEQHGDEDVDGDPPLAAPVAAERDVQVVAQPEGQGDVPPSPEVLEVDGRVGPAEVLGEPEAHQQGEADGDVGVAAEVGVDLDGVAVDGEQHLEGRVLLGVGEHRVDHVRGQVGGEHHLLGQAGHDQPAGLDVVDVRSGPAGGGSGAAARCPARWGRPPGGGRRTGRRRCRWPGPASAPPGGCPPRS